MEFEEILNNGLLRGYQIKVPSDLLQDKVDTALLTEQKGMLVNGYRKGKVPLKIVKQYKLPDIFNKVVNEFISSTYEQIIDDNKFQVVGDPTFKVDSCELDSGLTYTVNFDIYPELPKIDFSQFTMEYYRVELKKEDVTANIDKMEEYEFIPSKTDYVSKAGDNMTIDFTGKVDGKPFKGGNAKDFVVPAAQGKLLPEMDNSLVGKKNGEEFEVDLTFPESYSASELVGKTAVFSLKINNIEEKIQITDKDKLVAKFNCKDFDDLFVKTKKVLDERYKNMSTIIAKSHIFEFLDQTYDFDVPAVIIEKEMPNVEYTMKATLSKGEEVDKDLLKKKTIKRVKTALLLMEYSKECNIRVEPSDMVDILRHQAGGNNEHYNYLIDLYKNNEHLLAKLEGEIIEKKVCEQIIDIVKKEEKIVTMKEIENIIENIKVV